MNMETVALNKSTELHANASLAFSLVGTMTSPFLTTNHLTTEMPRHPASYLTPTQDIALMVVIVLMSVFCIVANGITFLVIATNEKLSSSPFNVMLMSLCLSDFISALSSPFNYYKSGSKPNDYQLGVFMCKATSAIRHWTTILTMQHILVFIILRILALKHPHIINKLSAKKAAILAFVIWIESFGLCAWYPITTITAYEHTRGGKHATICEVQKEWVPVAVNYSRYAYPVIFFPPMVLIVALTIYMIVLIYGRRKMRRKAGIRSDSDEIRKENFAMFQLSLIVSSFLFGYLPELASRIFLILIRFYRGLSSRQIWVAFMLSRLLFLRVSECVNPVVYNLASSKLRNATKNFLRRTCCCGSAVEDNQKSEKEGGTVIANMANSSV